MLSQNDPKIVVKLPSGEDYVYWAPFPKQVAFHQSNKPNLLARGSRGSGKSVMLRADAHMRAMQAPGQNLVLIRKTLKDLRKNHLLDIHKEMKMFGGYYHETNFIAYYPNGSRLFFSYVGHEKDALNLLGAELLAAYYDELSTIPWEFFIQLSASVRVKRDSGLQAVVRAATNPYGESAAEVEKYFVNKDVDPEEDPDYDPDEWGYIQINAEDNPYLDLEQYRRRLANLPPHLRKAWVEGEYTDEEALFDFTPTRNGLPYHVIDEIDLDKILERGQIYRAIDFGWHPDPTYVLWIAHLGNRFIAFHEMIRYKTIIPDLAELIKVEEEKLGIKRTYGTYIDPSADIHTGAEIRTNAQILIDCGIPVECSINNRALYASAVHTALAEEVNDGVPRLQIYRGNSNFGCPYLVKAIPLMRYDAKRPMYMADHRHDHPVVTLAYFLISHASIEHRSTIQRVIPRWMRPRKSDRWVLGKDNVRHSLYN